MRYKIALDIFEINLTRVIIYSVSWLFKIVSYLIIAWSFRYKNLTKITCYLVLASQKIHMVALNAVALDLIMYGLRSMFQVSELSQPIKWASVLLLSLLIYDFCEIYHIGGTTTISEFEPDSQKRDSDERSVRGIDKRIEESEG